MPPKAPNLVNLHDEPSDDESRDPGDFLRALQQHTARVEQVVQTDREAANQNLQRLLQDNQSMHQESTNTTDEALTAAVGRAISQSLLPTGAIPAQLRLAPQPPPVQAFGGLRLQPPPPADSQSAFSRPSAPDPWPAGTQSEYQHSGRAAAAALPEPLVYAPFAAASDPGRFFVAPELGFNPYTAYNPQVAGRQRVLTVSDPPTKRDLAEAFVHVQQASRHSQHIGRREVAELQLLECFVQVWNCRRVGLPPPPPRDKLRIFDRVRLLYHVAQSGWGAALEGSADPSASILLGPPVPPRRPTTTRTTSPERTGSPTRPTRPSNRSQRPPKSPKKPKN
ncbi:unnamed protein product [Ixodes persulcatus]